MAVIKEDFYSGLSFQFTLYRKHRKFYFSSFLLMRIVKRIWFS